MYIFQIYKPTSDVDFKLCHSNRYCAVSINGAMSFYLYVYLLGKKKGVPTDVIS